MTTLLNILLILHHTQHTYASWKQINHITAPNSTINYSMPFHLSDNYLAISTYNHHNKLSDLYHDYYITLFPKNNTNNPTYITPNDYETGDLLGTTYKASFPAIVSHNNTLIVSSFDKYYGNVPLVGCVYIFENQIQTDAIYGSLSPNSYFGLSIAVSGNYLFISEMYHKAKYNHAIFVYEKINGKYNKIDELLLPEEYWDAFGIGLCAFDKYLFVYKRTIDGQDFEKVYVYTKNRNYTNTQIIDRKIDGNYIGFGYGVECGNGYLFIGAYMINTVHIYKYIGGKWDWVDKVLIEDETDFGKYISMSNDYVIVGGQNKIYWFKIDGNELLFQDIIKLDNKELQYGTIYGDLVVAVSGLDRLDYPTHATDIYFFELDFKVDTIGPTINPSIYPTLIPTFIATATVSAANTTLNTILLYTTFKTTQIGL